MGKIKTRIYLRDITTSHLLWPCSTKPESFFPVQMGKIKKRIYPRDITINIGKGTPVPKHPYPGKWKRLRD
jgi:hypothetical protein